MTWIAFVYIVLMWILGPKSKLYWGLAGIPTLILLITFWPAGLTMLIRDVILIPLIIPKVKAIIQPKIDRLLDDVHTLAEEARKKEP